MFGAKLRQKNKTTKLFCEFIFANPKIFCIFAAKSGNVGVLVRIKSR
jgi:hypothetical protein